jgi:hypothetical protein
MRRLATEIAKRYVEIRREVALDQKRVSDACAVW